MTSGEYGVMPLGFDLESTMPFSPDLSSYRYPVENGYGSEYSPLQSFEMVSDSGYRRSEVLHWTVSGVPSVLELSYAVWTKVDNSKVMYSCLVWLE